jgi:putative ABC transport system permease protein
VKPLAQQLGASLGGKLTMIAGGQRRQVRVCGIIQLPGTAGAQLPDLVMADLATAQELTGSLGRIDRIDMAIPTAAQAEALSKKLPAGLVLESTVTRSESIEQVIGSYRLNLAALSLMASFVAVFLVYNAMLVSVEQRMTSLGILRCLGATRAQLGAIYLIEAAAVALIGGVLGVLGGWALSRGLVGLVATTINDLYAAVRPGAASLTMRDWIKGMSLSAASCLVGAAVPVIRAAKAWPVTALRRTETARASHNRGGVMAVAGVVLLSTGAGLYWLPTKSPLIGFAMALVLSLGFALLCPWLLLRLSRFTSAMARRGQWVSVQVAARGVGRSLSITGVAVAATMLALSMDVGIGTMVRSFRDALSGWVDHRFGADIFVATDLMMMHRVDSALDDAVVSWVTKQPTVAQAIATRRHEVAIGGQQVQVLGTDAAIMLGDQLIPMKSPVLPGGFEPAADVLISEPLAGRMKLGVGDELAVSVGARTAPMRVYGIYYDFGNEHGQAIMDRASAAAMWGDQSIDTLTIRLKSGNDAAAVASAWRKTLRATYPVTVDSFGQFKIAIMTVFDRTFAVTKVLTWMAGGVAFCGLAGSLLALAMERRKDHAVLSAVGMTGGQTIAWVLGQGFLIAWISAAVAAIAGTVLSWVLANVIQYRSFGWSIPTHPQVSFWIEAMALATAAALVAAAYPIVRLRRWVLAATLRQE